MPEAFMKTHPCRKPGLPLTAAEIERRIISFLDDVSSYDQAKSTYLAADHYIGDSNMAYMLINMERVLDLSLGQYNFEERDMTVQQFRDELVEQAKNLGKLVGQEFVMNHSPKHRDLFYNSFCQFN